jgi:NAD+ synthase (glutamine-hydrolysing)
MSAFHATVTGAARRGAAPTLVRVPRLRLALCQIDTVVGDLDGNVARVLDAYDRAEAAGCDLAVFPELTLTGYPPEDLVLKPGFVSDNLAALGKVAARTDRCAAVVGFVDEELDLHNAAAVCAGGSVVGTYRKRLLPNYAVFDEQRYFTAGHDEMVLFVVGGVRVGVSICEDAWSPTGPIAAQAAGGAELVVNLNASPYYAGRLDLRQRMLATRAADASCALVYVNQVGGQDELVFDGASMVFDHDGQLVARAGQFTQEVLVVELDVRPVYRKRLLDPRGRTSSPQLREVIVSTTPVDAPAAPLAPARATVAVELSPVAEVYEALVIGLRDYVAKNRFSDVVLGLSGGIDSTLVACIGVDALGAEHVHGVSMPSRYSSQHSRDDAADLAGALGVDYRTIAIEEAFEAFGHLLAPSFAGRPSDLAEENLQSRIRGMLLMALSNKLGWLVVTTGNKSEMAVGYSTLYGDSAGGFAVIKDVPKLLVYELSRYVNERHGRCIVNDSVLTKPPSAELRPDQRDDQSLPPYEVLDVILERYVEGDHTAAEIVAMGIADEATVRRICRLVDLAEYKRRQCPPGVRVTPKAFGKDRRLPITNGYRG